MKNTKEKLNLDINLEDCSSQGSVEMRGFEGESPYPIITYTPNITEGISSLSESYNVPTFIICETLSLLYNLGFINEKDATNKNIGIAKYQNANSISIYELLPKLEHFCSKLSKLHFIQEYKNDKGDFKKLPRGIFRITSLYDMDFSQFKSVEDFLDFLYMNVSISETFFQEDYYPALKQTTGLQVSGIEGKEHSHFVFEKYSYKLGEININDSNIDVKINIIPGISPTGITILIGLDLPNNYNTLAADNFFYAFGFYFSKDKKGEIIPIIHTIQNSPHNIGFNKEGSLMSLKDPLSDEQKKNNQYLLVDEPNDSGQLSKYKKSLQRKITAEFEKLVGGTDPEEEFLALICDKLFLAGFKEIQTAKQNLWLTQHTDNRSEESVKKTMKKKYHDKLINIGAHKNANGNIVLTHKNVLNYLSDYPNSSKKYKQIILALKGIENKLKAITNQVKKIPNTTSTKRLSDTTKGIVTDISKVLQYLEQQKSRNHTLETFDKNVTSPLFLESDETIIELIEDKKREYDGIKENIIDQIFALQSKIYTIMLLAKNNNINITEIMQRSTPDKSINIEESMQKVIEARF